MTRHHPGTTLARGLLLAALFAAFLWTLARPINLANADLGRLVASGEIVLEEGRILQENHFSYTHPHYPFVNHHWGGATLFALAHGLGGIPATHVLFLAAMAATFAGLLCMAWRDSGFAPAFLAAAILLPLVATRSQIRPEGFSYLLFAVFLALLWRWRAGRGSAASLALLPLLTALWVNLHSYFVIGVGLVGLFAFEAALSHWRAVRAEPGAPLLGPELRSRVGPPLAALAASAAASLANPAHVHGALFPFTVFGNEWLAVFENQTLFFIASRFDYPPVLFFGLGLGALAASGLLAGRRGPRRHGTLKILLCGVFAGLALLAVRNLSLFGLAVLPVLAANLSGTVPPLFERREGAKLLAVLVALGGALLLLEPEWFLARRGLGAQPGVNRAAELLERHAVRGPYFNTYDIGGYLVYHLFPRERVFVDNRAEAYPPEFFHEVYRPAQRDEAAWEALDAQHGFNALVLYRNDKSRGAQRFMRARFRDPEWALVHSDDYALVFLRRSPANRALLDRILGARAESGSP